MKGFGIHVKNDLLEKKHVFAMGQALWLYLWFLDHMTSITEEGVGRVLGGRPIKYDDIYADLGISEKTYNRWVALLRDGGYIETTRAPYGMVIHVFKAVKPSLNRGKRTVTSDGTRTVNYDGSRTVTSGERTVKNVQRTVTNVGSNKTYSMTIQKTNRDFKKSSVEKPDTNVAGNTSWKPDYDSMKKPKTDTAAYRDFELRGEYIKSGASIPFEEWYAERKSKQATENIGTTPA